MRKNRPDIAFATFALLIIAFSCFMLFRRLSAGVDYNASDPIGIVIFKHNEGQRRPLQESIWSDVEERATLFNGDSIRTASDSGATLEIGKDIALEMSEMSLVALSIEGETPTVDLDGGAIRLASESRQTVRVRSGTRSFLLSGDALVTSRNGQLSLLVQAGEARVEGSSGETVSAGEILTIDELGRSDRPHAIRLLSPAFDAHLVSTRDAMDVAFRFETHGRNARIEISADGRFDQLVSTAVTASGNYMASLPVGTGYYWRVVDPARPSTHRPEIRRLYLERALAPQLYSPEHQSSIPVLNEQPLVVFRWSSSKAAAAYRLDIARDGSFDHIHRTLRLSTRSIGLYLPEGDYHWRVVAMGARGQPLLTSDVRRLSVAALRELESPVPLRPANGTVVVSGESVEEQLVFAWRRHPGLGHIKLEIASDPLFGDIYINELIEHGSYWRMDRAMRPGVYHWRLRGSDRQGQYTPYSETRRLNVVEDMTVVLRDPTPEAIVPYGEGTRVTFRWHCTLPNAGYRFLLARDAGFRDLVRERETRACQTSLALSGDGTYHWTVRARQRGTDEEVAGESRRITGSSLPSPDLIAPADRISLPLHAFPRIVLRWTMPPIPDPRFQAERFILQLFRIEDEGPKRLLLHETVSETFALPSTLRLGPGDYAWSVRAVVAGGNEGPENKATFRLERLVTPTPEGNAEVQYLEE